MALTEVSAFKDGTIKEPDLDCTNTGSDGQFLKKAGTQFTWDTVDTSIADDSIAEVKLDISNAPSAGKFLQYKDNSDQLTWALASSPEVYGFNVSGSQLQVTTTNGGADNIDAATYASFDDVVFAATGITFTLDLTTGNLVATI